MLSKRAGDARNIVPVEQGLDPRVAEPDGDDVADHIGGKKVVNCVNLLFVPVGTDPLNKLDSAVRVVTPGFLDNDPVGALRRVTVLFDEWRDGRERLWGDGEECDPVRRAAIELSPLNLSDLHDKDTGNRTGVYRKEQEKSATTTLHIE